MNIRKIVTYNALRKQFTAEELAFADVLFNATESERELLVNALQPEKSQKKAGRKSSSSKSLRATGIERQLSSRRQQQTVNKGACTFILEDGAVCNTGDNNPIHDESFGYAAYHPFQPAASSAPTRSPANDASSATEKSTRRSAPPSTPESDDGEERGASLSGANSEASAASAGAATGGSSE